MKISIVSLNNDKYLSQITDAILRTSYDIKLSIFSKDYDKKSGAVKMTAQVEFAKDLGECLKGCDVLFNLISSDGNVLSNLENLNKKYPIDVAKALYLQDLVGYLGVACELDEFAGYIKSLNAPVINMGASSDVVTLYLYRAHGIVSYGLNLTAHDTIPKLLKEINLDLNLSMLRGKLGGIDKFVWLSDIRDDKGRDLYPTLREYTKDVKIDSKREELTRQPLKSMAFYGYYHSGAFGVDNISSIVLKLLNSFIKGSDEEFYFNVINKGSFIDIEEDIPIVSPCKVSGKTILRQDISLPIPLMLAMTDMISSMSLVVSTMISRDYNMFIRTVKLDSYLMTILTLEELDELAKSLESMFNLYLKDKE